MARKLQVIAWEDHCDYTESRWRDIETIPKDLGPLLVISTGWVIHECPECVILAATMNNRSQQVTGNICILKPTIKKRWNIKDPSVRKK